MSKSEPVLVTGGAGFIGSHVVDRLLADGFSVEVIDDLSTGRRENLPEAVPLHQLDIASSAAFEKIGQIKPKYVIHLAAQIDVRRSLREPKLDAQINIVGGLNVVKAALAAGVEHLVFASSAAVYGRIDQTPVSEDVEPRPVDHYGVSKMAFEHYLRVFREVDGLTSASLRFANVYGPRQTVKGEAGVVAIFLKKLLRGERPLVHGDGKQTRDFVYVTDVAEAAVQAIRRRASGVFNVSTGRETSVNQIAERLGLLVGIDRQPEYGPAVPNENRHCALLPAKAARELGWTARMPLDQGLAETFTAAKADSDFLK